MPIYEYKCVSCGLFQSMQSMSDWSKPQQCPNCKQVSNRVISAPNLSKGNNAHIRAHAINERSQHEPKHACKGHSHDHKHDKSNHASVAEKNGSTVKSFPNQRPWMIGH